MSHKAGNIHVRGVMHIPLVQQDMCKVDAHNGTDIIVNINQSSGVCQVAVKSGVLWPWYVYHKLRVIPDISNNKTSTTQITHSKIGKQWTSLHPRQHLIMSG
jgi:hypothetical protein